MLKIRSLHTCEISTCHAITDWMLKDQKKKKIPFVCELALLTPVIVSFWCDKKLLMMHRLSLGRFRSAGYFHKHGVRGVRIAWIFNESTIQMTCKGESLQITEDKSLSCVGKINLTAVNFLTRRKLLCSID